MKIERRRSIKKPLIIGAVLLAVIAAGVGGYLWWQRSQTPMQTANVAPTNTVDYNPPTEEQQDAQDSQKDDILNRNRGTGEGNTTTPSGNLIITVTRAGQMGAGELVNVRTIVAGTSDGVCDFTFRKGSMTFTKSFPVTPDATTTVCNGDVDASNFSESGEWQLSAVVKKGSDVSSPATWDLTVTK